MKNIFLLYFVLLSLNLQAKEYFFETITSNDGLSQNDVLSIFQDSEGFIWFGTIDGLNRYDGYEFKVYRYASGFSNSISGNMISYITEDNYKNLWIGTLNNGVSKFNMLTEEFTQIKNTDSTPALLTLNHIRSITCDAENNIWLATFRGITIIKPGKDGGFETQKIMSQDNNPNSLLSDKVNRIHFDSKGRVWVSCDAALDLMRKGPNGEIQNNFYHLNNIDSLTDLNGVLEVDEGHLFTSLEGLMLMGYLIISRKVLSLWNEISGRPNGI